MDTASFVGIDVHKRDVVVGVRPGGIIRTFPQTPAGHQQVQAFLLALQPTQIVVEATGGYQRALVRVLQEAGLPVRVVNPRQVAHFATGVGRPAKTDAIDAQLLAHVAEVRELPAPVRRSANERAVQDLTARRRSIQQMHVAEQNRSEHRTPQSWASLARTLAFLEAELALLEREIAALIAQDPDLRHKAMLLQAVPGVGPRLATTLCAEFPELGTLSRQQAAALAGLAPATFESGPTKRAGAIHGGRAAVRTALYLSALSAIRCNPVITPFYQRLRAHGKTAKQALIACARKLLVILNAMIRDDAPWHPQPAQELAVS